MFLLPFNLSHVFQPDTPSAENAEALRVLLECMVGLNMSYLKRHTTRPIYQAGVRYGRTKEWEPIPSILARRTGDCKSLAPWLIAQYRLAGIQAEPAFRFYKNPQTAYPDFHILVELPPVKAGAPSTYEDPSRILGMGRNENARF